MSAIENNLVVPDGDGFATKADLRALATSINDEYGNGSNIVSSGVLTARAGWQIDEQRFHRKGRLVFWQAVIQRTGTTLTPSANGWIGSQDIADIAAGWRTAEWWPVPGGYGAHRAATSGAITSIPSTGVYTLRIYCIDGTGTLAAGGTFGCSGIYSL
ncbi:MAG: hypothetical protein EOP24_32140 [Hyphomicrobiales bacterium]|nr:MAG: hypothetical protein EOP24_32140 [Hyphomicrobiales bacterium]